jgi:hypothetical protein
MFISCVSRRVHLPTRLIKDLQEVNKLSSKNRWEYGGKVKFDKSTYKGLTYTTSKERTRIDALALENEWNAPVTYHTHPSITNVPTDHGCWDIFTTLPSSADFEAYIKGFPDMQVNIITDAHGYYVINVLEAVKIRTCPLPRSVATEMTTLRFEDFLYERSFGEDGCEYFATTLRDWKCFINEELAPRLMELYGISIHYYGYDDVPPTVIVDA